MVFKVSKGGVRTGNTLRGLRSKRTKIYGRHACLLGFSSLRPRDLDCFLDNNLEENVLVAETLRRTNVLLSLNKRQRWRVPAALNQLISCGSFNKYSMISLLERHKLKRRANCIRFACSGGASERLADVLTSKKYFSFTLDNIDKEISNRQKKRRYAEALKKQARVPKVKVPTQKNTGIILSEDVATKEGKTKGPTNDAPLESTKEEYRVEVFYPCPQSCSLTFNPKYTDVFQEEGKSGELEVKFNLRTPYIRNSKRHHRRCISHKDIDLCCDETIIEEDVRGMWEDFYASDSEKSLDIESKTSLSERGPNINYIDILLNQAQKAQKLPMQKKHHLKKPRNVSQTLDVKKPHIVYMAPDANEEDFLEPTAQAFNQPQYLQEIKPLDSVKVILKSIETSEESLQKKYGMICMEAHCYPRRFMINITADVANLLSSRKSTSKNHMFVSYLVFIHDGVYDDGLDVYRVIFNSHVCNAKHNLSECMKPFSILTIHDIMNNVIGYLLDLKERNELECLEIQPCGVTEGMYSFLYNRLNQKVHVITIDPATALSDKSATENEQVDNLQKFLSSSFDVDIFCGICYDDLSPTKMDAVYGTKLKKCGHHFCDSCWASHFQSRMRDRKTTMTCPGYDCKNEVGLAMLLSIINVSKVALLFQRKVEEEVDESENAKWCPNSDCGRAIKIDSSNKDLCQDVVCACGKEICFACFAPAHWPATCNQAEDYIYKLSSLKPPKEIVDESDINPIIEPKTNPVYEIEGKVCPQCSNFLDKIDGCNYMKCKCGRVFCWNCMKPYHSSICQIDRDYLFKYTRLLRIHHIERSPLPTDSDIAQIDTAKRKATLYQRAMQQRLEASKSSNNSMTPLVLKIVSAANTDLQFKQEIIRATKLQFVPEDVNSLGVMNVKPSVVHLIKSSQMIKRELHHVTEFSYVLLQSTRLSVEKQRIQHVVEDLGGICSMFTSIFDLGDRQDAKTAFQRLISIQEWATRALDALIAATYRLRRQ